MFFFVITSELLSTPEIYRKHIGAVRNRVNSTADS